MISIYRQEIGWANYFGALTGTGNAGVPPMPPIVSFSYHQQSLSSPRVVMSTLPSTSTSHSKFAPIFNAALETYKRKTKKDIAKHPLLPRFQSCGSPEAILNVLQEQVPASGQSRNSDKRLTRWVPPTVNVLHSFSAALGEVAGLVNRFRMLSSRICVQYLLFRHSHQQT
jgi:hypothetical protein